jgi:ubiquinone/menaquinone biosynthesis C-methylase UbiE
MAEDHIKSTVAVYNSIAAQYAVQAEAHAPEPERQKFCGMVKPGGWILDVGCGSGRDCAYFETHGFEVQGIDLSESLLTIARKVAWNSEFYNMDMRQMNFPDGSFDGVWACAAIIHLKRPEIPQVLSSFLKILKPGGALGLLVKAGTQEGFAREPSVRNKARYYTYFSQKEIKELAENAGFKVTETYSYNEADRFKDGYPTDWIACFATKP